MNRIIALIIKELISLWRDKKTRFILIFPPLWQLFIFSFAATLDVKNVTIGILNRDHGEKGFELVQRIKGSPIFTHVVPLEAVESVAPFINEQTGPAVLSIDEEFSRKLDARQSPTLQLILDGRKSNTSQIVAGYVTTIVNQFAQETALKEDLPIQPIELITRNWFNPNLLYNWFTIPGLLVVLTMVEALLITGLSVARERELGTFDQLLVSPLRPSEILIGKTIPAILVGLLEGLLLILAILLIFQIPFEGSFPLLLFSMLIFVTAITGVGLFISSLCSTHLNPARYFMYISRGIFLKDLHPSAIFSNLWPLALIALFNLTAAARFFRRRFAL